MPRIKSSIKMLSLDIEMAPIETYTWSLFPKYLPIVMVNNSCYMLSWAAKWEGQREMIYKDLRDEDMVTAMWDLLEEADAVITYNGDGFDFKHLNREFAERGLGPPTPYSSIDLYKTVKRQFKLPSNKLDYVAQHFGVGKKVSHAGFDLWRGCMSNSTKAWATMCRYNKQDVRLLPKLYKRLLPWVHNHPNLGMWTVDPQSPVCPTCSSTDLHRHGQQYNTKTQSYQRWRCNTCGTNSRSRLASKASSPNVLTRIQ
jgi:DNA polymerase elongation subunit (family B)